MAVTAMTDATMKVASPLDLPVTLTFTTTMKRWREIQRRLALDPQYDHASNDLSNAIRDMMWDLEKVAKWACPEEQKE